MGVFSFSLSLSLSLSRFTTFYANYPLPSRKAFSLGFLANSNIELIWI